MLIGRNLLREIGWLGLPTAASVGDIPPRRNDALEMKLEASAHGPRRGVLNRYLLTLFCDLVNTV